MPRHSEVLSRNQLVHGLADQIEAIGHAIHADELAPLLGVSLPQLYKLAKKTIPSFHIKTSVRFDPRSVAQWLRNET